MCIQCQQHSVFTTFAHHSCTFKNQPSNQKCCRPFEVVGAICTPEQRRALLIVAGISAEKTLGPARIAGLTIICKLIEGPMEGIMHYSDTIHVAVK